MTNRLKRAMARLADRLLDHSPQAVTWTHEGESVAVTCLLGDKLLRTTDEYGNVRTERTDKDFLVKPDALAFPVAGLVKPQRGQTVRFDDEATGNTLVYKVLPYADEPAYRDRMHGEMLRVHAKLHAEIPALALLDEAGEPLYDEAGEYILAEG